MTEVLVAPRAARHLEQIEAWWHEQGLGSPTRLLGELAIVVELLRASPLAGPPYPRGGPDVRRITLRRSHYHLYYRYAPEHDRVELLAVWHNSRRRTPRLT